MVALPIKNLVIRANPDFAKRTVEASIVCDIGEDIKADLSSLIGLGPDKLEVVIRRRPPTAQEIQSAAEPAPAVDLPWNGPSKKVKTNVSTDVPQTQPEPEEPTTAQLVEEFGSWG